MPYWVSVDVEAHYDAPCPGLPSGKGMTEFGAVLVDIPITEAFWGIIRFLDPGVPNRDLVELTPSNLKVRVVKGHPTLVMQEFDLWLHRVCGSDNPRFLSDNNGYDWQWINHAFWSTIGRNPFGHSSTNLGSLYKGMMFDFKKNFKHLRDAAHTHNPVDDALGNAQAFLKMRERGLKCGI